MTETNWYNLNISQVFSKLKTDKTGLTKSQVSKKQSQFGLNELPKDKKFSAFKIFTRQLSNVLIFILLIAGGLTFFLKEWLDFGVIASAIVINIIVGFIQELKAEKALSHLQTYSLQKAKVLRDGVLQIISAEKLVPGDILLVEAGDQIPADARLIEVNNLHVNEAILTGESTAVAKKVEVISSKEKILVSNQTNMIFKGTLVTEGKAKAIVCGTGLETQMGKIADMLQQTESDKTPLQKQLAVFSRELGIAVLFIAFLILIVGLIRGFVFREIFMVSVAVAVSAIPEGLLVAITVTLVIGMQRILAHKALVRKLVSAETLGSTSIVCVDKTGTLTKGEMQTVQIFSAENNLKITEKNGKLADLKPDLKKLINYSCLCNNAFVDNLDEDITKWKILGSPTEKAILEIGVNFQIDLNKLQHKYTRIKEIPFDSTLKKMTTIHKDDGQFLIIQKGAPEIILNSCDKYEAGQSINHLDQKTREDIIKNFEKLSAKGLRLLAVAYKTSKVDNGNYDKGLIFLGYIAIKDPIRKDVLETIKIAKRAGVRTIMITGDYKLTASAIAKELGLKVADKNIITGKELDGMSDEDFTKIIKNINVYARVTPQHKLRIVSAWRSLGEVVAMTGDGVNDAPALKSADIGIAVGSGTDVTKATADMILLDNNFSVIIEAIKEGRKIFLNIKKVIVYLLADSFSEVILVFGSLLLGLPLPITAAQILWINLITDGFPAAALTVEKSHDDVMQQKPRAKNEKIFDKEMKALIFIIGIFVDLILLSLFYYLYNKTTLDLNYIRTILFAALGIDSLFYVFSCKSLRHSIFKINIFDNKFLNLAVISGIMLQLVVLYVPALRDVFGLTFLGALDWSLVVSLAVLKVVLIEVTKYIYMGNKINGKTIWNY